MTGISKKQQWHLIGALLFALLALLQFTNTFGFLPVLYFIIFGGIAFLLVGQRRDIILCGGFALLALISLFSLLRPSSGFNTLLSFLAYALLTLICLACLTDYLPQFRGAARKIWFLPAACFALVVLISFIGNIVHGVSFGNILLSLLKTLIRAAAVLAASIWVASPEGFGH
ncbi:MAG: hypothetical protein K6B40_02875 [Firmicutes bacterium]|nr:hypothetical protein [Bacillota bacterium]